MSASKPYTLRRDGTVEAGAESIGVVCRNTVFPKHRAPWQDENYIGQYETVEAVKRYDERGEHGWVEWAESLDYVADASGPRLFRTRELASDAVYAEWQALR